LTQLTILASEMLWPAV